MKEILRHIYGTLIKLLLPGILLIYFRAVRRSKKYESVLSLKIFKMDTNFSSFNIIKIFLLKKL